MPIRVQNDLPVKEILEKENIFVMDEHRATHQDIRPIKIGLLDFEVTFKYSASSRCKLCDGIEPPVQEYTNQSFE